MSSASDPTQVRLDHIVVLVPHQTLREPPAWLTQNFTLTPGGRHGDGRTENKLIAFRDGTYIELIAFINDDPANREGHSWGGKQPGIIDMAFTTTASAHTNYEGLQRRLQQVMRNPGVEYSPPVPGARHRPSGQEIKWEVTFPRGAKRGELPFFCHDLTPRERRVPRGEEAVKHPCGATGVQKLTVILPSRRIKEFFWVYGAVLNEKNTATEDGTLLFNVGTVDEVEGAAMPQVIIQPPRSASQKGQVDEHSLAFEDLVLGGVNADWRWVDGWYGETITVA